MLPIRVMFTLHSDSEEQTEAIASALAIALTPPTVICLQGDLGAGKTGFVAGFVHALDSSITVNSPTYALAHTYPTTPMVYHLDLYRAQGQDLEDLGLMEMIEDPEALVCIEWPEPVLALLNHPHLCISFTGERKHRELNFSFSKHFSTDRVLTLRDKLLESLPTAG